MRGPFRIGGGALFQYKLLGVLPTGEKYLEDGHVVPGLLKAISNKNSLIYIINELTKRKHRLTNRNIDKWGLILSALKNKGLLVKDALMRKGLNALYMVRQNF